MGARWVLGSAGGAVWSILPTSAWLLLRHWLPASVRVGRLPALRCPALHSPPGAQTGPRCSCAAAASSPACAGSGTASSLCWGQAGGPGCPVPCAVGQACLARVTPGDGAGDGWCWGWPSCVRCSKLGRGMAAWLRPPCSAVGTRVLLVLVLLHAQHWRESCRCQGSACVWLRLPQGGSRCTRVFFS